MKFLKQSFFIICVTTFVFATGCRCKNSKPNTQANAKAKQEISINIVSDPDVLDPRKARRLNDGNLLRAFMDGLMRIDQKGAPAPAIAKSYNVSEDSKRYVFRLKETFWSNGDPLTAHDFVYAWKKSLTPDFMSDCAFGLYPIKNAKHIKEGILPTSMLGVTAVDDYTLAIDLEHPTPFFLDILTNPIYFPVNARVDREDPKWSQQADSFVCNGPFMPTSWKKGDEITAVKNPNYWEAKCVQLERIAMVMVDVETGHHMFKNKELHWDGSPFGSIPVDAIASLQEKQQIHTTPGLGTYWIRTNVDVFPLHSEEMRKALALAVDRKSIVDNVTMGGQTPATGIVPASMGIQTEPYFLDGDFEDAAEYLQIALNNEKLTLEKMAPITLTYYASTRNHRLAQALQEQWRTNLGLTVKLEPVEGKVYFDRISKQDFQLACGDWIADNRDPLNFLEVFKTKHVGTNNTNWESPNYIKAIEQSYSFAEKDLRSEKYREAEQIIMSEMPVIPLFHYSLLHVQNEDLKDVILTESGQIDFKWAYLE